MQLSSARVGGLAPARETVTAAALAACVRSWQGGPLYLVCHWDSLSKGWNFGFIAQNSGDRAHFASRKSTITHNWTQELREAHTSIRGSFWAGSRLTHGFLTAKIYSARHTALIQLSRVIRRIIAACHLMLHRRWGLRATRAPAVAPLQERRPDPLAANWKAWRQSPSTRPPCQRESRCLGSTSLPIVPGQEDESNPLVMQ